MRLLYGLLPGPQGTEPEWNGSGWVSPCDTTWPGREKKVDPEQGSSDAMECPAAQERSVIGEWTVNDTQTQHIAAFGR